MDAPRSFRFGAFTLDASRGALTRGGEEVSLRPKSFAVLQELLARHGQLVSKQELLDAVWPDTAVTEGSLTQCLIEIRRALGDDGQHFLRTIPRRGVRFDAPVQELPGAAAVVAPPGPGAASWSASRALAASLVAASLVAAALAFAAYFRSPVPPPSFAPSLAVLPFADASVRADQQPFSDGFAEAVLDLLARTEKLRVVARASSFSFRNSRASLPAIARALDVTHVLSGRVERADGSVSVTVTLTGGATGRALWSKRYERPIGDLLGVQREIAAEVARELGVSLGAHASGTSPRRVAAEAHEAFHTGQFFYYRRAAGDLARAQHAYERAVAVAPDLARAWVGLAAVYRVRIDDGDLPSEPWLAREREAVQRALALDSSLPEAHVRASNLLFANGEQAAAAEHMRRAEALGPHHPLVLGVLSSRAASADRFDEAAALLERAIRADPINAAWRNNRQVYLLASGRYAEAWQERDALVALRPSAGEPACVLLLLLERFDEARAATAEAADDAMRDRCAAMVSHAQGRTAERDAALERLRGAPGIEGHVLRADVLAYLGHVAAAFSELERALDLAQGAAARERSSLAALRESPFLRVLWDEPRWRAWLDAARRVEAQAGP